MLEIGFCVFKKIGHRKTSSYTTAIIARQPPSTIRSYFASFLLTMLCGVVCVACVSAEEGACGGDNQTHPGGERKEF